MTTSLDELAGHLWDDVLVLRQYPLRAEVELIETARFREDVWSLAPAGHQKHIPTVRLDFTTVPSRYRLLAKELLCAFLAMPLPSGEQRLKLITVEKEFRALRRFLSWLYERRGGPDLGKLEGSDLLAYSTMLNTTYSQEGADHSRTAVRRIWRYRTVLPGDRLRLDPHHVVGWLDRKRRKWGENRTDRLPEQVMGPLIVWATRFVEEFAPDILAAVPEWTQHNRDRRSSKRSDTPLSTVVRGHIEGTPWLNNFAYGYGENGFRTLTRLLQTACYILLAFYSGMRDSEVKHLHRGCLRVERDPDGIAYRWKVHSMAFKGESDHRGVRAVWVVGEHAGRAVQVLEALQPEGVDALFRLLPYGPGRQESEDKALTSWTTNQWLRRFISWVNHYCSTRDRFDGIPDVDGVPWKLKTTHFRRTLAWFIARQPGGATAGAIAFRHHAIQMFEGYAGTSDSGFRAEVESEQALARGEFLVELADLHRNDNLVGPGAEEAERRLEQFGIHVVGFGGSVISDERRLARLMKRHDPAIYPGTYVTCVFNHDKALCRKQVDAHGDLLPDLADCKPLNCGNVALTASNIGEWQAELGKIDLQLSRRPRLPPLLEHRLTERRGQIANLLTRHIPTEEP